MKSLFVVSPVAEGTGPGSRSSLEERRKRQRRMGIARRVLPDRRAGQRSAATPDRRAADRRRVAGIRRRIPDRRIGLTPVDLSLLGF